MFCCRFVKPDRINALSNSFIRNPVGETKSASHHRRSSLELMAQFFLQLGHLEYYGFLFSTFDKYNWFLKLVLKLVGCFWWLKGQIGKIGVKGPKKNEMKWRTWAIVRPCRSRLVKKSASEIWTLIFINGSHQRWLKSALTISSTPKMTTFP